MTTFKPGVSGNPSGRPKGSLNRSTQLIKIMETHAEALINKTIELGLLGDPTALRLCIERLLPKAKDKSATVIMPDVSNIKTTKIMPELLQSLGGQEIEISDFKSLMEVFIAHDNEVDHSNRQHEKLKIDATDPNEAAKASADALKRKGLDELEVLVKNQYRGGDDFKTFHALRDIAVVRQSPEAFFEVFQFTGRKELLYRFMRMQYPTYRILHHNNPIQFAQLF